MSAEPSTSNRELPALTRRASRRCRRTAACACCSSVPSLDGARRHHARSSSSSATICRRTCPCGTCRPWRMARPSPRRRCSRAPVQVLRRALESLGSDHRAHPLRLARQHAAQDDPRRDGGARRPAAGAARARFGVRPVPSQAAGGRASQRQPHAAARERVHHAVDAVARFLRRGMRDLAVADRGAAESGARAGRSARPRRARRTCSSCISAAWAHARAAYDLVQRLRADCRKGCATARAWCWPATATSKACASWPRRSGDQRRRCTPGSTPQRARSAARRRATCSRCRRAPRACPWRCSKPWRNGLPSITSPVGGIPDVFRDGVDGVLVTPGDVEQIRAAMARLITDDTARCAAGRAARERARALRRARVRAPPGATSINASRRWRRSGKSHERDAGIRRRSTQAARGRREPGQAQSVLLRTVAPAAGSARERRTWRAAARGRARSSRARSRPRSAPTTAASCAAATRLSSWPLLDKELLRNRLHAFTTGNEWFSAPANTGGTAGVPLKLVRSLDGVVFEQACIDRLVVQARLASAHACAPRCCAATTCRIRAR